MCCLVCLVVQLVIRKPCVRSASCLVREEEDCVEGEVEVCPHLSPHERKIILCGTMTPSASSGVVSERWPLRRDRSVISDS